VIGKIVGLICAVLIAIAIVYWVQYPSDTEPNRSSTQPSSNNPVTMTFNGSIISRPEPLTFTFNSVKIEPEETKYIIQTTKKYIIHLDSFGGSSNVRGIFYGYPDCGDKETIRLLLEFEKHKMEYECGVNSSDQMYDLLQKMLSQLNSAIYKGMLIEGLAENLFQNNLYDRYWITNGVITSYDWNSPEEIAKSTVEGWMNSEGHRSNILYPYFESEGIGVVVNSDHKVYITQNFC